MDTQLMCPYRRFVRLGKVSGSNHISPQKYRFASMESHIEIITLKAPKKPVVTGFFDVASK